MEMQAGELFANRYRLIKEVGRGSFGEVWQVRDEQLDLEVALKVYIALDERGLEEFDEGMAWRFLRDVAGGLAYLHGQDILHRDIKPDNILRNEAGDFVITDFGISLRMRSTLRRNSTRAALSLTWGRRCSPPIHRPLRLRIYGHWEYLFLN